MGFINLILILLLSKLTIGQVNYSKCSQGSVVCMGINKGDKSVSMGTAGCLKTQNCDLFMLAEPSPRADHDVRFSVYHIRFSEASKFHYEFYFYLTKDDFTPKAQSPVPTNVVYVGHKTSTLKLCTAVKFQNGTTSNCLFGMPFRVDNGKTLVKHGGKEYREHFVYSKKITRYPATRPVYTLDLSGPLYAHLIYLQQETTTKTYYIHSYAKSPKISSFVSILLAKPTAKPTSRPTTSPPQKPATAQTVPTKATSVPPTRVVSSSTPSQVSLSTSAPSGAGSSLILKVILVAISIAITITLIILILQFMSRPQARGRAKVSSPSGRRVSRTH